MSISDIWTAVKKPFKNIWNVIKNNPGSLRKGSQFYNVSFWIAVISVTVAAGVNFYFFFVSAGQPLLPLALKVVIGAFLASIGAASLAAAFEKKEHSVFLSSFLLSIAAFSIVFVVIWGGATPAAFFLLTTVAALVLCAIKDFAVSAFLSKETRVYCFLMKILDIAIIAAQMVSLCGIGFYFYIPLTCFVMSNINKFQYIGSRLKGRVSSKGKNVVSIQNLGASINDLTPLGVQMPNTKDKTPDSSWPYT